MRSCRVGALAQKPSCCISAMTTGISHFRRTLWERLLCEESGACLALYIHWQSWFDIGSVLVRLPVMVLLWLQSFSCLSLYEGVAKTPGLISPCLQSDHQPQTVQIRRRPSSSLQDCFVHGVVWILAALYLISTWVFSCTFHFFHTCD